MYLRIFFFFNQRLGKIIIIIKSCQHIADVDPTKDCSVK